MSKRNDWTDYEIGFIQDHDDWTNAQISDAIGRTKAAVQRKRSRMRAGWTPVAMAQWTKAEDDFLLANPRLSTRDVASHLNRTRSAITYRRRILRGMGLAEGNFGGNWSPTKIGARPLLAKTCIKCGLLLQAKWFGQYHGIRKSSCFRCSNVGQKQLSAERKAQLTRESDGKRQSISLAGASQHRQPWTERDFVVLGDPDMTILQKALVLHRTYSATKSECFRNGFKSVVGLGDPERDQWIIDNPNVERLDEIIADLRALDLVSAGRPSFEWDD